MKKRKIAIALLCLFFVYVVLSLFNSLYWMPVYEDNAVVMAIGEITDGETLELFWIPGQFLTFALNTIVGADVTFLAALLTFLTGGFVIIKLCGLSMRDLVLLRET